MPRIAKWKEKNECVKYLAPRPVKLYFEDGTGELKIHTIEDLIEDTIEAIMPKCNYEEFSKFVDAKNLVFKEDLWEI